MTRSRPRALLSVLFALFLVGFVNAQSVIHDVIYEKKGGAAFTMDIFKPEKPNGAGVMWIISGGWFSRHEDINPQLAQFLNSQGFTVFEVVHGSQPKYQVPEILEMLTRAIRFIHANASTYGIDPNRLGVAGGSAGGHLALMLAADEDKGNPDAKDPVDKAPSTVKAVVAYFPPTDFLNWGSDGKTPFKMPGMQIFWPAFGFDANTPDSKALEVGKAMSPIYKVTSSFPPTLLIHGDKDTLVPIQQSQIMDAALTKAGVKHKFVTVPGGGHGDATTLLGGAPDVLKWFQENL